jgi:hypothetical protein
MTKSETALQQLLAEQPTMGECKECKFLYIIDAYTLGCKFQSNDVTDCTKYYKKYISN